jgi:small-conductance mechanosensitive channel
MDKLFRSLISLPLGVKLAVAALGTFLIQGCFRLLERTLPRVFAERDVRYRVRKFLVIAGYATAILFLTILFEDRLGRISFALGVAGAGVAVALQDVMASFAGWFSIGLSKLYTVGNRIQIGDTKGDVIDISILRTTLMETGSWVSKDVYSGRVVRVPNSQVLKGQIFNYSQGFPFVWDEIKLSFSTSSDQHSAREVLLRAAKETVDDYLPEAQDSWKRIVENFHLENPHLAPTASLTVNGGEFEFTVNYVVPYTDRTAVKDRIFTRIVDEVTKSNDTIRWALPPHFAQSTPADAVTAAVR